MDFEIESLLLDCHTSLMGIECEIKLFDLDSTLEPKPTLEFKVNFPELVLFPNLTIQSPNHSFHQITFYCWTKILTRVTQ